MSSLGPNGEAGWDVHRMVVRCAWREWGTVGSKLLTTAGSRSQFALICRYAVDKLHLFAALWLLFFVYVLKQSDRRREEFRAPAGVRKSPRKEPADHRLMLWRFRFSADVRGGETAANK